MRLTAGEARRRAASSDHAVLATTRPDGTIDLVPVCFAMEVERDDPIVAIPIEQVKPKGAGPLQRERNLAANPKASLLCERWDAADWSRLWWVRLRLEAIESPPDGLAAGLETGLRARYPQYSAATFDRLLVFRIVEAAGWSAS